MPLDLSMLVDLGGRWPSGSSTLTATMIGACEGVYEGKALFGILSYSFPVLVPWDSSLRCSAWARS